MPISVLFRSQLLLVAVTFDLRQDPVGKVLDLARR